MYENHVQRSFYGYVQGHCNGLGVHPDQYFNYVGEDFCPTATYQRFDTECCNDIDKELFTYSLYGLEAFDIYEDNEARCQDSVARIARNKNIEKST